MLKTVTLNASALTDVETAMDYLRVYTVETVPHVTRAINEATATCERYTGRKLKSQDFTWTLDGTGKRMIYTPEWPVTAVAELGTLLGDGSPEIAMDMTGMVLDDGGMVFLPNDVFPLGSSNVRIVATCGYLAGTHDDALSDLERACLRLVQVYYQDWLNQMGRAETKGVAGTSASVSTEALTPDVKVVLDQYARIM